MAYDEITYANKVENNGITPAGRFGADDLNEIKAVTNANGANFDGRIDVLEAGGGSPVGNPVSSSFVGDGATVSFVLTFTPTTGSSSAFVVGIDGVLQSPVDAYTVSTNTGEITFSSAPPVGSDIVVTTSSISATDISESTVVATGSTEDRKLTDRFADTVNVKDFGAVGDGVTDDTVAIQAAVDVGGEIIIPAGTYLISSAITVTVDSTKMKGDAAIITASVSLNTFIEITANDVCVSGVNCVGNEAIGTYVESDFNPFISATNCSNVSIKNLEVSGKSGGVLLTSCSYSSVSDILLNGFLNTLAFAGVGTSSIKLSGGRDINIENCTTRNHGSGVILISDPVNISIKGCYAQYVHDNGVYISSGTRCSIIGCHVDTVTDGSGIKARGSYHSVTGNVVTACADAGINLTGNGGTPDAQGANGSGTSCTGNTVSDCGLYGIRINKQDNLGARNFIVSNNSIENTPTDVSGNGIGIFVLTTGTQSSIGHIISNNSINHSANVVSISGIYLQGTATAEVSDCVVTGNVIRGNGSNLTSGIGGIYVADCVVKNNIFKDVVTDVGSGSTWSNFDNTFMGNQFGVTISAGAITISKGNHTVDTEANAATDDLDTINGASRDGQLLVLSQLSATRDVTYKNNTGNLLIEGDFTPLQGSGKLFLIWEARFSKWVEISRTLL